MVRLDLYDHNSNNGLDNNKDHYTSDTSTTPTLDLSAKLEEADGSTSAQDESITLGPDGEVQQKEGDEGKKTETSERSVKTLCQVWCEFLGGTSLHGCKNVRESRVGKRLAWCTMILFMAIVLGWALTSLFLKYQQHPFVTVWSFQRETQILAPGVTICLPVRFNRKKLEMSDSAYQMLAYESTGIPLFDSAVQLRRHAQLYYNEMKFWEKKLDNTTVHQAQKDIGFTRDEVFLDAKLYSEGREIDIRKKLMRLEWASKICWMVQWLLPDTVTQRTGTDLSEIKEDFKDVQNSEETEDMTVSNSGNVSSNDKYNKDNDAGKAVPDMNMPIADSSVTGTIDSAGIQGDSDIRKLSDGIHPASSKQPLKLSLGSTATPTFYARENDKKEGEDEENENANNNDDEEDDNTEMARKAIGKSKNSDLLRLYPRDFIMFTMNLQQHNWLSNSYLAGAEVYLHDPVGGFWSIDPILLRPGTYNAMRYTTTNYKFLPPPYTSFSGVGEFRGSVNSTSCVDITSPTFQNPMVSVPNFFYSADLCMQEYAENRSTRLCGCGVNAFFNKLYGTPLCSILQHTRCFLPTLDKEYTKQTRRQAYGTKKDIPCPQACTYVTFEPTCSATNFPTLSSSGMFAESTKIKKEDMADNLLVIDIKPHGPQSVSVEHVPELTVLSILGSAGGWMGLCLGASLLTLTEFFEAVAMSVWILYRKLMGRLGA